MAPPGHSSLSPSDSTMCEDQNNILGILKKCKPFINSFKVLSTYCVLGGIMQGRLRGYGEGYYTILVPV